MIRRRHVFIAGGLLLAGCAAQTSQLAQDAQLIAGGLQAALPSIQTIQGISASVIQSVQTDITEVSAYATDLANQAATTPTTIVQQIGSLVQEVGKLVIPFLPAGSSLLAIVQAAISLLPALFAAVGLSGAPASTPYQVNDARLILRAASATTAR
jgi:hypothetical protein